MGHLPRNVILDLLPAYIAGEASEESRTLVEEFAKNDPEIASLLKSDKLESAELRSQKSPPDDLEMRTFKRVRRSIRRQMWYVAIATASLLMIPLIAMYFTDEVNWTLSDFIIMGFLLVGAGLTYVLISRISDKFAYKLAVGIAVATGLLLIWMNLAVGIIGSEDNVANLLYGVVIAVELIGALISQFQPRGMSRTMFATAITQMLVPVTAMIIWQPSLDNIAGIFGVFLLNAFFAALFAASGILFRFAAQKEKRE